MAKIIERKTNKSGVEYALMQDGETFGVWRLRENYAPHLKGGMSRVWRYIEKDLPRESADKLFNRRAA